MRGCVTDGRLCSFDFLREEREVVVKEAGSENADWIERDDGSGARSAVVSQFDGHATGR